MDEERRTCKKKLVEKDWKALPRVTNDKSVCYILMFERGEPSSAVSSFEFLCTKMTYCTQLEIERVQIRCINTSGITCIHYHFHQGETELSPRYLAETPLHGRYLELGSGTGLVGMACALLGAEVSLIWSRLFLGSWTMETIGKLQERCVRGKPKVTT